MQQCRRAVLLLGGGSGGGSGSVVVLAADLFCAPGSVTAGRRWAQQQAQRLHHCQQPGRPLLQQQGQWRQFSEGGGGASGSGGSESGVARFWR